MQLFERRWEGDTPCPSLQVSGINRKTGMLPTLKRRWEMKQTYQPEAKITVIIRAPSSIPGTTSGSHGAWWPGVVPENADL